MAKISGPLFSSDAAGTHKDALTFSIWKGQNYAKGHFHPTNPKTTDQQSNRSCFSQAIAEWQAAYLTVKEAWNLAARDVYPPISGYNYFLSQYVLQGTYPTIPLFAPKREKTLHSHRTPSTITPPSPWLPTSMPQQSLWVRSDLGLNLGPTNLVISLSDQFPSSNLFTVPPGFTSPLWEDNQLNGKPHILFDGASARLYLANLYTNAPSGDPAFSFCLVARFFSDTSGFFSFIGSNAADGFGLYHGIPSPTNISSEFNGGAGFRTSNIISYGHHAFIFTKRPGPIEDTSALYDFQTTLTKFWASPLTPNLEPSAWQSNQTASLGSWGATPSHFALFELFVHLFEYQASDLSNIYSYLSDRYGF